MTVALVPRVDLSHFQSDDPAERAAFVETLGRGLTEIGFVVVGGHGLESALTSRAYELFAEFFALPEAEKARYICRRSGNRGYSPFGRERAKDAKVPDLKEFWHVCRDASPNHPDADRFLENIWPERPAELKEIGRRLYRDFDRCARSLLQAIALHFELPARTFSDMAEHGNSVLRVIHYPPLGESVDAGAVRAAAHEDINLITLLIESRGGGLEIQTRDGSWHPVNALAGDIIVDSGDMLSRVTNGVIPATTHRVVNPSDGENLSRYSMPFFVHPYPSCDLSVHEAFVSAERPARFPPTTADAFLTERLKEIGLLPHSGRLGRIKPEDL